MSQPEYEQGVGADVRAAIAANLRRGRMARGLSLRELAERTGTSKAFLSQLERAVANPTLEVLARVAGAVGLSVSDLIRTPLLAPEVIRRGEGPAMTVDRVLVRTLFSTSDRRRIEMSEGDLQPHTHSARSSHGRGSLEIGYVLTGPLTLVTSAGEVSLDTGDVVRFSAEADHTYVTGQTPARLLTIVAYADE